MLLSGAGLGLIYVYVSNGFACDPFLGVVVSCSVNEKTTRQGGFFEGSETGKFLNRGNWLVRGAQSPKLFV